MNKEARTRFLRFAESGQASWKANFRDLNAAITRMATLAAGGRISVELVDEETQRLKQQWQNADGNTTESQAELSDVINTRKLDHFDQIALAEVVRVCRKSNSLSEAGRKLFAVSRLSKAKPNDADRLRKYLARFGLSWDQLGT